MSWSLGNFFNGSFGFSSDSGGHVRSASQASSMSGNIERQNAATTAYQRNAQEAEKSRAFNAQQAQINRDYQTKMSNTAVERRMADLKNSGLNPILAAGGSASSPSGSVASGATASAPMAGNQKGAAEVIGSLTGLVSSAARLL